MSYCVWTIRRLNTTSVEEKSDRIGRLSLSLAEGIHKLLQLSGPLDLEEHLVVVVGDLDIEMLAGTSFWLLLGTRTAIIIRAGHIDRG